MRRLPAPPRLKVVRAEMKFACSGQSEAAQPWRVPSFLDPERTLVKPETAAAVGNPGFHLRA